LIVSPSNVTEDTYVYHSLIPTSDKIQVTTIMNSDLVEYFTVFFGKHHLIKSWQHKTKGKGGEKIYTPSNT
jgi:hypothetical protein